ncbi:Uncharacterised protein [Salmonella enterica subsp. arizonae]|nr:Uncharacterised protein [Salmonella enterica subsp. arizonae]
MTNMDSKKLKRCAQIILFFYGASFFNRHFKFNPSLYLYNFFHPIFCGLLWILYIFREEKSVQITKRFHFIFFCSYSNV